MPFKEHDIEKIYWSIEEAAIEIGIAKSLIRFYDDELNLKIGRAKHGCRHDRSLRKRDIDLLKLIVRISKYVHLEGLKKLKEKGMLNQIDTLLTQ